MSILSNIGNDLKKFFGIAVKAAVIAEPFIDVIFPGFAPLFNGVVAEAVKVEALAAAVGAQSGSGTQKLALVVQAITPSVLTYAEQAGLPKPTETQIQNLVNAAVAALNSLGTAPAPAAA